MRSTETSRAPGFRQMAGQPQDFAPHPIELPALGPAVLAPAEELLTALTDLGGTMQPMIIIAAKEAGMHALALGFRPTREQAARLAQTLAAFAEGREADLLTAART